MRQEKQLLLDEIKEKIDLSKSMVLASYQQLTPNATADFRMNIAKHGGCVEVVRKRILVKAAEAAGFGLNIEALPGHIAIIFSGEDPVATTKLLYQFSKDNNDVLEVVGGRFEGQTCSSSDIELISQMPNKEEMRAQFLGLLEAPMSQTLAVVEALLTSVMHCIENKSQEGAE